MIRFTVALFALVFWFSAAYAEPGDPFGKALMARIKSEGFRIESIKTTFLRRIKIDSRSSRKQRQTVYNPVTGDVLQDRITDIGEESFLSHVTELFAIDIRNGRNGRSGAEKGNGKSGSSGPDKGKSGPDKGKSGSDRGKSGSDKGKSGSDKGKPGGKGNAGQDKSKNGKSN